MMNAEIEQIDPLIGQYLQLMAGSAFSTAWVRVEMTEDFGSVGVFLDRGTGTVDYLTDMEGRLFDLFSELLRRFADGGLGAWTQATFTLDNKGSFKMDLDFDDVSDLAESSVRRDAWMARVLGSQPQVNWPTEWAQGGLKLIGPVLQKSRLSVEVGRMRACRVRADSKPSMQQYSFGECAICRQGRLLAARNPSTGELLITCDDCESQWHSPTDAKSYEAAIADEISPLRDATMSEIEEAGWASMAVGVMHKD